MSEKQWVQHISGQGEKYEVNERISGGDSDSKLQWVVNVKEASSLLYYLPKSEYILCPPPERWKDVTEQCEYVNGEIWHYPNGKTEGRAIVATPNTGYRRRKVKVRLAVGMSDDDCFSGDRTWAFIVEKKEPS